MVETASCSSLERPGILTHRVILFSYLNELGACKSYISEVNDQSYHSIHNI